MGGMGGGMGMMSTPATAPTSQAGPARLDATHTAPVPTAAVAAPATRPEDRPAVGIEAGDGFDDDAPVGPAGFRSVPADPMPQASVGDPQKKRA
jgi:hypothetical protein